MKKKKMAFTLVELLIVIAVIAILFVVYVSKVGFATDKAKLVGVQTDFRSFYLATKAVQMECDEDSINNQYKFELALNKNLDDSLKFNSGVSNSNSPWGTRYKYVYDNSSGEPSIMFIANTDGFKTIYYTAEEFKDSLDGNKLNGKVAYGATITSGGLLELTADVRDLLANKIKDDETTDVNVESITITNPPTKVVYDEGDRFDPTGMVVTASYSDGTLKVITDYTIDKTILSNLDNLVTIYFNGKETSQSITVGSLTPFTVTRENKSEIGFKNTFGENLIIPSTFTGSDGVKYKVTSLGDAVFYNCDRLNSVVIPDNVTVIPDCAFYSCINLKSVNIPNGVTSIKGSAFYNCSSLSEITIPNSVISIGSGAFSSCTGLTSVDIPSTVTSIEENAFNSVSHINYSGSATGFPWAAFSHN